jgi:hypothetical protein
MAFGEVNRRNDRPDANAGRTRTPREVLSDSFVVCLALCAQLRLAAELEAPVERAARASVHFGGQASGQQTRWGSRGASRLRSGISDRAASSNTLRLRPTLTRRGQRRSPASAGVWRSPLQRARGNTVTCGSVQRRAGTSVTAPNTANTTLRVYRLPR